MRALYSIAAVAALVAVSPAAADEATDETAACLAEAVYYEARGTGEASRAAVAHVVLNRADSGLFPATPCAVVAEGCQFSYRCDGRPERMAHAGDRAAAFDTAEAVLEGDVPDPTAGALFFHAARIAPEWFETRIRVGEIGGHVFYR
jgi:N-acetylmuramoyl-L-alanine amidase